MVVVIHRVSSSDDSDDNGASGSLQFGPFYPLSTKVNEAEKPVIVRRRLSSSLARLAKKELLLHIMVGSGARLYLPGS